MVDSCRSMPAPDLSAHRPDFMLVLPRVAPESRPDEAGGELLIYTILTRDADPCIAL